MSHFSTGKCDIAKRFESVRSLGAVLTRDSHKSGLKIEEKNKTKVTGILLKIASFEQVEHFETKGKKIN